MLRCNSGFPFAPERSPVHPGSFPFAPRLEDQPISLCDRARSVFVCDQQTTIAMEHLKTAALIIHIIGGSVALLTGLYNMIARKGGPRHRKAGTLFAWGMYAVAISALVLSIYIDSLFFFCLGVFTFYMTWNGQRSAVMRKVIFDRSDRLVLLIGTLNTILMLVNGNAILFGLGVLSATLVVRELILFRRVLKGLEIPINTWLVRHIGMMVGSYISTLTAFLVVNWKVPDLYWVPWVLPPIVFVPYIVWWSRKVTKRSVRDR